MNLQFTSITPTSDRTWTFAWADTGADSYRLVLYGIELAVTSELTYEFDGIGFTLYPPPIELVEGGDSAESESFRPYMLIQWYQEDYADSYTVEEYDGANWNPVKGIDEAGEWVYSYTTQTLEDDSEERLRVTASDILGNPGPSKGYTDKVLCNPATPDGTTTVSYSAGNIVVDEVT
jgi:hypothetical protein